MSDLRCEIEVPARILTGIGGLDKKMSDTGWAGLFVHLIEEISSSQKRLVAAIEDATE